MNKSQFASAVAFSLSVMIVGGLMILSLFAALLNSAPTYAAPPQVMTSNVELPIAAFQDEQLKLFGFGNGTRVIANNTNAYMSNHVWSPNGNLLAYVAFGDNGNQLMLTDSLGRTPEAIVTGVNSGMPMQFTSDNSQLIYAIVPDPNQAGSINDLYTVDVMSYTIGSNNSPVKLGSFEQPSCGGGGPSVYDALYWAEAGQGGFRSMLAVNEFGIIHSQTCQGIGVAVMNPNTGVDTVLDAEITNVKLSADGQTLVGIKNGQLMIIDVATGESQTFSTTAAPEQVIWGALDTGNIYYSVRQNTGEVVSFTPDEQQTILNATNLEVSELSINQVGVHRFNIETNADTVVYETSAYAIGQMTLLPDNRLLMVSEIPSLDDWFSSIANMTEDNSVPQLKTELYLVSLEDAETRLLGTGLLGARLNVNVYVRLFGGTPQLSAQPNTLTVGSQVRLNGSNFPANSHVEVYMGINADTLDETPYAAGFTNDDGEITLSFNLPLRFANGQAIGNGKVTLVGMTSDDLFSATTTITVNTPSPSNPAPAPINTGLPTPAQVTTVSISPYTGSVGTQININGQGFPANQRVNVHLGSATVGANNAVYATAFSDNTGRVSLTFNMPGVYADGTAIQASQIVIIVATDDFSRSGNLLFNFVPVSAPVQLPAISLSPTTVKLKGNLTVRGTNFPANSSVSILLGRSAQDLRGTYATTTTDGNGSFEAKFKMPERWKDAGKIEHKQLLVVAIANPSGASASAKLGVKLPKNNNNSGGEQPSNDNDSKDEIPTGEEQPSGEEKPSGEGEEQPSGEDEQPTGEQPSGEGEEQPSGEDEQSTGEQPSGEGEEQPSGEDEQPTGEQPSGEGEDNTSEEGEPSGETDLLDDAPIASPSVSVNLLSAAMGDEVIVSGSDFEPNTPISIYLVGDLTTSSFVVDSDENGAFEVPYIVPSVSADEQALTSGNYTLFASTTEVSASTPFTISG